MVMKRVWAWGGGAYKAVSEALMVMKRVWAWGGGASKALSEVFLSHY
jgi:hypothetical protein